MSRHTRPNDAQLTKYVQNRFTDHFKVAFDAAVAGGTPTKAPFAMPEYVLPGTEAAAADQRTRRYFVRRWRGDRRNHSGDH